MPDISTELADSEFRAAVREWLGDHLSGDFAGLRGRGWPGDGDAEFDGRVEWERHLGAAGWIGLGWPTAHGGRRATIDQQIIFAEEYARAQGPGRVNHMGEHLLGPTLIEFGTAEQQRRFLPPILDGSERWCQGYSEPDAGSDLANVSTRAVLGGDEWVIDGQKVWTSLAHTSHWCFVIARTEPRSQRHRGLGFFLVPIDQDGVDWRPIVQLTGDGEFNEVFFSGARTGADRIVGEPGQGWSIAMALLGFERGISTLAQQIGFARELQGTIDAARAVDRGHDPVVRQALARAHTGLAVMCWNAQRWMRADGVPGPEASLSKLAWGSWHRALGELMIDVRGIGGVAIDGDPGVLTDEQRLFLFSRADTIYGGSNQVQRNVLGERVLGLPR